MRLTIPILTVIAALAAVLPGCNTVGCTDNRSSIPLAAFYASETRQPVAIDSVAIGGVGAPGDSLIVKPQRGTSQFYMPLRSTADRTLYFISYRWEGMSDRYNDTISLEYTSKPFFASEECGAMFRYRITKMEHTSHLLDSIVILDSLVTNAEIPIIRIYYTTGQGDENS